MDLCIITRSLRASLPSVSTARSLATLGHRVDLVFDPSGPGEPDPGGWARQDGLILHLVRVPKRPARWMRDRARRSLIGELLRRLDPEVVHLAEGADRKVVVPGRAIVLQELPEGRLPAGIDACVTADGRFLDRSGRVLACPGVPPRPSASPVSDGLDPEDAITHWRALTYLSGVDQLRRRRRVRFDPPHGESPADRWVGPARPLAAAPTAW